MGQIKLSILIASIPSRFDLMQKLYSELQREVGDRQIEILCFIDNKKRSIGYKRDALLDIACGDYIMYIDDDEDFFEDYIKDVYDATSLDVDIITFKSKCTVNGKSCIVDMDLNNPINEEVKEDGDGNFIDVKRRPFHVCAWRRSLAIKEHFPDVGYGEDWDWCSRVLNYVKTQHKIDKVLHHYIFNSAITEAPTQSNKVWKNPNDETNSGS